MIRIWLGMALLSASWLLGLQYYQPANWPAGVAAIGLGVVLFSGSVVRLPDRRQGLATLIMLLPAVWFMPWPFKAAPLLISIGLVLELAPIPRRWPGPLARAAVAAGVVLLAQSLTMLAYAAQTARSHELPRPMPWLIGGVARLLGIDTAVAGNTVTMHTMRQVYPLGATWELLIDPATLCFFVGGLVVLGLMAASTLPAGKRWSWWLRSARILTVAVVAWLPIRTGLLIALLLHRSLRADPTVPLSVMNQFLSPWVHLLFLAGPVLLAVRFVRHPVAAGPTTAGGSETTDESLRARASDAGPRHSTPALALIGLAVAVFSVVVEWNPVGTRQPGRVMVVERHSTWEPTDKPYSTDWYGELASYNYSAIYRYCSQYFQMSRLPEAGKIDDATLQQCDVLVIKTPTARYSPEEVAAVVRFVEQGGGLLLVGDHTNVFKTSTYLNDVARKLGFSYRNDLLFNVASPYAQWYRPPVVPHPIVQHLPPMRFAVSCSIDPGHSRGRAVIRGTGLWSLPPEYRAANFHPEAEYRPEMRYGAFIQLWASHFGQGRVLAFTDSTIFSNFCTFQTGKAELMVAMLEWLNYRSRLDRWWVWLLVMTPPLLAAAVLLIVGLWLARARHTAWLSVLAAGILGWVVASWAVAEVQRMAMPPPEVKNPLVHVVVDRTVSDVPLSQGPDTQGEGRGYGLLEQWIPRLGYFTSRVSGPEAFSGNALVVLCPTRSVSQDFRERLVRFVAEGGRLLVVDSPDVAGSTANSLLWDFGLAVNHAVTPEGRLMLADNWPDIKLAAACEVAGGEPLAWVGETPVAARTNFGNGSVMAIGFGGLFNDENMGSHWMLEPDTEMLTQYDVLFALLRAAVTGQALVIPPPRQPQVPEAPTTKSAVGR